MEFIALVVKASEVKEKQVFLVLSPKSKGSWFREKQEFIVLGRQKFVVLEKNKNS